VAVHPAESRGLRELYVTGRHLRRHWRKLADRLEATGGAGAAQLREGSDAARAMLSQLTDVTAARELWGKPAAQGFGAQLADLRNALVDPALEINQAQREDEELRAFIGGWGERMRAHEDAIRDAAIGLGDAPAEAIAPCTPGLAGRAAHGLANRVGTIGEWFDRRSAR